MESKDIRWKQRFQNFERSLNFLELAINVQDPDIIQKAGLIQFFEMTFELAWKVMRDYLEGEGFENIHSPKAAIKKAFETGLLEDGHVWIELLEDRNITTHAYDEATAEIIENFIRQKYYPLFKQLNDTFSQK